MKVLGYVLVAAGAGIIGYFIGEQRIKISLGSSARTGLGAAGVPRLGQPKGRAERLATHKTRYGTSELPPRGTGLSRF